MSFDNEKPTEKKKKVAKTFLEASEPKEREEASALVAKKDFRIVHNEYDRNIKVGDDLSDVPSHYHPNLKTEGVL